jgi:hypothetical protein
VVFIEIILHVSRYLLRTLDIPFLRALITAAENEHENRPALYEIHTIARSMVDPHLADPTPDRSDVAAIAECEAADADQYLGTRGTIPEAIEPALELLRLANFKHSVCSL